MCSNPSLAKKRPTINQSINQGLRLLKFMKNNCLLTSYAFGHLSLTHIPVLTPLPVTISCRSRRRDRSSLCLADVEEAILRYFILFYFILFYFILFYFILFYFILFYFISFYFISFDLFDLIQFYFIII